MIWIIILWATVSAYCVYLLWRNRKVLKFRLFVIDLCYEHSIKYRDGNIWISNKHSYDTMLFSFKPLTLEAWFTKEEIERVMK